MSTAYNIIKSVRKFYVVLAVFCINTFFGCSQEPVGSEYLYFGWIPDGSGLVAVKNNNDDSKTEVSVYNKIGEIQKQFRLGIYVSPPKYDDRIYFSNKSNCFFLLSEDYLYLVNYQTEESTLLLKGENFVGASPSGNKIITWRSIPDSMEFKIYTLLEGGISSYILKRYHDNVNFRPYTGFSDLTFLNDSVWTACYSDSSGCSLTLFNDRFVILNPTLDTSGGFFSRYATNVNKLFYVSSNALKYIDLDNNQIIYISPSHTYTASLAVDPNGNYCLYSTNEERIFDVKPGTLRLYDVKRHTETIIASGIASGGQISPDGKSLAYFTNEAKDIHPHIIPIP